MYGCVPSGLARWNENQLEKSASGWKREIKYRWIEGPGRRPPPLHSPFISRVAVTSSTRVKTSSSRTYGRGRVPCGCTATGNYIEYNDGARGSVRRAPYNSASIVFRAHPRRRSEYRVTRATTLTRSHPPTPRVSYVRRSARVILHRLFVVPAPSSQQSLVGPAQQFRQSFTPPDVEQFARLS